jgi:hypothetical protein
MRMARTTYLGIFAAALALSVWTTGSPVRADDNDCRLEGSWKITISSPPNCQGTPPACNTASELANFYPGGTLTETNTILFATSEPNPPSFSGASDGYGFFKRTDTPNVFSITFQKFLFQTQEVPISVSPTGKLVVNAAVATVRGKYTVHSDGTLSGTFTITIVPTDSSTVLFQAEGSVQGTRLGGREEHD